MTADTNAAKIRATFAPTAEDAASQRMQQLEQRITQLEQREQERVSHYHRTTDGRWLATGT